jgi:hypothetical protein
VTHETGDVRQALIHQHGAAIDELIDSRDGMRRGATLTRTALFQFAVDAISLTAQPSEVERAQRVEAAKRLCEASQRAHYRYAPSITSPHHLGEWVDCNHPECSQDRILADAVVKLATAEVKAPADYPPSERMLASSLSARRAIEAGEPDAKNNDVEGDGALIDKAWEQYKAADIAAKGSPRDIIRGALDPFRAAADAKDAIPQCTCPTSCDCQNAAAGLVSEECPEHNVRPKPSLTCLVHGEDAIPPGPEGATAKGGEGHEDIRTRSTRVLQESGRTPIGETGSDSASGVTHPLTNTSKPRGAEPIRIGGPEWEELGQPQPDTCDDLCMPPHDNTNRSGNGK